jgi:hypothetical protein
LALSGVEAGSETKDAHVISFINHVRQGQALSKDKVFTWQLILDRVPTRLHASFAGGDQFIIFLSLWDCLESLVFSF